LTSLTHCFLFAQNESVKLAAQGCPVVVTHWINCGRKLNRLPVISDLSEYGKSFNLWWASLQPATRIVSPGVLSRNIDGGETWVKVRKGSINGFYTAILALSFWHHSTLTSAQRRECNEVIEDALWVADQLIGHLKHPRDDDDDPLLSPKRYVIWNSLSFIYLHSFVG